MKGKKNNTFLYILIIIIFLGVGITAGVYGTKKFLNSNEEDDTPGEVIDGPMDITESKEYSAIINKLHASLGDNSIYYSSKGLSLETMDNSTKLTLMYNFVTTNSMGTSEELEWLFWGATTCENDFIVDPVTSDGTSSQKCTIYRIPTKNFTESFQTLFHSNAIDTSVNFNPSVNTTCLLKDSDYLCGKVNDTVVTGSLSAKFTIQKVTLEDDVISIYDKGYLLDTRSNKVNSNDGYQNHYLHTADSTNYYYELKNADNVTFRHDFKKADDNNYYYVSSTMVPKE